MPAAPSSGVEAGGPAAWNLAQAALALREGRLPAQTYARTLLDLCEAHAHLNAFQSMDAEELLRAAHAADAARHEGRPLGALHGLPIAVKDNIAATPYPMTAGTAALRDWRPTATAPLVRRVLQAGALVAGKTTMHELAMGWTGQNLAFGDTRNPHDPLRMAGGSSGGSACAVAAHLVPAAIGTDTNGSIRVPSAFCGIVGLRPTHGRYPLDGVVPLAPSLDTAGPMARCVADVALLDAVMVGEPHRQLAKLDLRGVRLGVCREWFWSRLDSDVADATCAALELLQNRGVVCVPVSWPDLPELLVDTAPALIGHEARSALETFLQSHPGMPALDAVLDAAGQDLASAVAAFTLESDTPQLRAAQARRRRLQSAWSACFARHRIDALVHPPVRVAAPLRTDDPVSPGPRVRTRWGVMTAREAFAQNVTPASLVGAPSVVLPVPVSPGTLPVGLQLDGLPDGDRRLLALAAAVEAALTADPR